MAHKLSGNSGMIFEKQQDDPDEGVVPDEQEFLQNAKKPFFSDLAPLIQMGKSFHEKRPVQRIFLEPTYLKGPEYLDMEDHQQNQELKNSLSRSYH
jgi:hypothetical protein